MEPLQLPADVDEACRRMVRGMDLYLAGIDLRLTPDGNWYCLEVNPSPGFTYFEAVTGQPIAAAVASLLVRLDASPGLSEILQRQPTAQVFDFLVANYFECGISGVQPKVLVPDADRPLQAIGRETVIHPDLIVKSGGDEFPHLTQNEFMCMSAARAAGIVTPRFWLSENGGLFVVERFDLKEGHPLGFEDMAVLMDRTSREKYQGSYENVAKAVRLYCADADPLADLRRLFEYIAFTVMVRNGDGHLKNFGLLYEHPGVRQSVRLAPLYDVVTTSLYGVTNPRTYITKYDRTLALSLGKSKSYPNLPTLLAFARDHCGVTQPEEVIERIADSLSATLKENRSRIPEVLWQGLNTEWGVPAKT